MRSFVLFVVVVLCAAGATAQASLPIPKLIPSQIAVTSALPGSTDNIHGTVSSSVDSCIGNRVVVLYELSHPVGATTTNADGTWTASLSVAKNSRFWAKAQKGAGLDGRCQEISTENVTVPFPWPTHALNITKVGSGDGSWTCDGRPCESSYPEDARIKLSATPGLRTVFMGWSGAGCSGVNDCYVDIDADKSLTASFYGYWTLTVAKSGTGSGSVTCNGSQCAGPYGDGTQLALNATPTNGSRFGGWSGAGCSGTGACNMTMHSDQQVTATFAAPPKLTVTESGSGSGALSCNGGSCQGSYPYGTSVVVHPSAAFGSSFDGWSGDCSGTGDCVVTMDGDKSVNATFGTLPRWTLSIAKSGGGDGSVRCNGALCAEDYPDGTTLTLSESPTSASYFTGWSGDCSGTADCTLTIDSDKSVTATFEARPSHTVNLTIAGDGDGSVRCYSGREAFSCGDPVPEGASVSLFFFEASNSRFDGWSGDCSGDTTCDFRMDSDKSITATFTLRPVHTLVITKSGTGAGSVYCNDSTCKDTYPEGSSVTLSVYPSNGSEFDGWSGDCSGAAHCTLTIDSDKSVNAAFAAIVMHDLSISRNGAGSGRVSCNGVYPCNDTYRDGSQVTLSAASDAGSIFKGWSGDCSGSSSTCVVTMDADKSVVADFGPVRALVVAAAGAGTGSWTCNGAPCESNYPDGTIVTLSATPGYQNSFTGWSGESCSGTADCVVTLDADRNVTATFEPDGSYLTLTSDPDDYIGQGRDYHYQLWNAEISPTVSGRTVHLSLHGDEYWTADFQVPSGSTIAPGTYGGATRYPFNDPSTPGLEFSSQGRGCNQLTGSFTIDDVGFEPDGSLDHISLNFVQHCENGPPALRGVLRYDNDDVAVYPDPGPSPTWQPSAGTPAGTYLYFVSDPGDYIGQGQTATYTPLDGTITAFASGQNLNFHFRTSDSSLSWDGSLRLPKRYPSVQTGYFPGVHRDAGFSNPTRGAMDFNGHSRGCNELSGWFTIDDVGFKPDGTLDRVTARFEQHCEKGTPALRAKFVYVS